MMSTSPWLTRLSWAGAGALAAGAGLVVALRAPAAAPLQAVDIESPSARLVERPALTEASTPGWLGVVLASQAIDVVAESDGRIEEMAVEIGDQVTKGQRLATLESQNLRHQRAIEEADLTAAEAGVRQAVLEVGLAEQNHRRRLDLEGLLSKEQIATAKFELDAAGARLEAARARRSQVAARLEQLDSRLARTEIRAPFDGTVALRYADPGVTASPGTLLVRLISGAGLMVRFAVPPEEATAVKAGTKIRVEVETAGLILKGIVEHDTPEIDAASQMIFVEARLPGAELEEIPAGAAARVFRNGAFRNGVFND